MYDFTIDVSFNVVLRVSIDGRTGSDDYGPFNDVWDKPDGGLHAYFYRFLSSTDTTFQHIAVWTIVQLLESGGMSSFNLTRLRFGMLTWFWDDRSTAYQQDSFLATVVAPHSSTRDVPE